ncbi:MAG: hypothetical protein Q4D78_07145 [Neisseria zoodegmatis]|uniref:hypothetical protein n=1 Tax=Neisseria TaxID=482 RepID=UPI0026EF4561|nr:hypothetical protein [Neisseria zoodegmatis]MDO5069959.1 hypothetical protein [Neisseria zoodegmatis]
MSFRVFFVVQALDDGTFLGRRNGERWYVQSFEYAERFESLNQALENARDIDYEFNLERIAIHPVYEPC